jgi:ParB/RepB/Spo0J family partition protein
MNIAEAKEIIEIPLEDIVPNRFQPRLTFDMEALNDLAKSIKEHGIIQPLVVRKLQDKYEIIAGERRYKAAAIVGLKKVPCIVMNLNDSESAEVAIIENIQRKEMTPLEEAKSFKKLLDKGYLTQEDLGKRMGKSQSSIANKLRLLNLDIAVQDSILNNKISERHARSLLKLQKKEDQRQMLSEIIEKRLTVKQTDDLIKERYGIVSNMEENISINDSIKQMINKENNEMINSGTTTQQPAMSTPEFKLPGYNNNTKAEELNPQLRILNSLGTVQQQGVIPQETIPVKNDMPDESTNPALNIFRSQPNTQVSPVQNIVEQQESAKLIDPSKLQEKDIVQPEIKKENIFFDAEAAKQTAQDIKEPVNPQSNIENLLYTDEIKHENKFFVGLENKSKDIPNQVTQTEIKPTVQATEELLEISTPEDTPKYKQLKDKITSSINEFKLQGTKIYKEEVDFGGTIQIIIRIDK